MSETPNSATSENDAAARRRAIIKLAVFAAVLIGLIIAGLTGGVADKLKSLQAWIDGFGALAPVVYSIIYIIATVFAMPGSALTLIAGGLFGPVLGTIIVSIASTIGASLAFLVSRHLLRGSITKSLGGNPKFRRLDELTERIGPAIVAITRLVPLFPFNLLNYGFGLTRVRFATYVFWSWLCMLPGTVFYVVAGAAITDILKGKISPTLIAVLIVDIILLAIAGAVARRKLKEPAAEPAATEGVRS